MSDTPRTDALKSKWSRKEGARNSTCSPEAHEIYALCEHLERDLNNVLSMAHDLLGTPRTDTFATERLKGPAQMARYRTNSEWCTFASQLERELTETKLRLREALEAQPGPSLWERGLR